MLFQSLRCLPEVVSADSPKMTNKEIDQHVETLKLLQRTDPAAAAALSETIVTEAGALQYERPLPYAHVVHATIIRMQGKLDEAANEFESAIAIAASSSLPCNRMIVAW